MSKLNINIKAKKLSDLISGLGVYSQDVEVTEIIDDTRNLKAGDTFLCLPRAENAEVLARHAVEKGASAIIVVGKAELKVNIPCACLPDMDAAGLMLRRWFETESVDVPCIGITGTDGKTSTAWMLREVLALHLGSAWSCGTLGLIRNADDITDLGNTTPSLLTLHTLLAMAVRDKIGALVLEVSSHGIEQQRIAALPFSAAIWTTMGQDHLEDHGGFAAYLACKESFVRSVADIGGVVVANADYKLIKQSLSEVVGKVFWYSQHNQADLLWSRKQTLILTDKFEEIIMNDVPLADFHAENLAAVALLIREAFEEPLSKFVTFDGFVSTPMGRLEPVDKQQQVFIDYAHTAEGLDRCLESAKDLTQEQLLLVFGCGGDRDRAKRSEMGAVAVKHADTCWLTSDNPRSERQSDIANDVMTGVGELKDKVFICEDRNQAIEQAVFALGQGDILVIAGKGHESYMEIKGERFPWSDKKSALNAMKKKEVQTCA